MKANAALRAANLTNPPKQASNGELDKNKCSCSIRTCRCVRAIIVEDHMLSLRLVFASSPLATHSSITVVVFFRVHC